MSNQTERLLLISNSTLYGSGYLDHAEAEIRSFLGDVTRVLFVPFALHDRDGYGSSGARIFRKDLGPVEVSPGTRVDTLVRAKAQRPQRKS